MRITAILAVLATAGGCSESSWVIPADAGSSSFDGGGDGHAAPIRCGSDAGLPDVDDPTVAVTDWTQVQHYNCARGDAGQILACSSDKQCPTGQVCDTSAKCGCCVASPPLLDRARPLQRALFTGCDNGRCSPPLHCTAEADLRTCTMTFEKPIAVWAMHYQPPANACPLDDFRRQLCIKVEQKQSCLWLLDLPGGSYSADAPFPTDYTDTYECGGRTCNGAETFRVRPNVGTIFTATLRVDNCAP